MLTRTLAYSPEHPHIPPDYFLRRQERAIQQAMPIVSQQSSAPPENPQHFQEQPVPEMYDGRGGSVLEDIPANVEQMEQMNRKPKPKAKKKKPLAAENSAMDFDDTASIAGTIIGDDVVPPARTKGGKPKGKGAKKRTADEMKEEDVPPVASPITTDMTSIAPAPATPVPIKSATTKPKKLTKKQQEAAQKAASAEEQATSEPPRKKNKKNNANGNGNVSIGANPNMPNFPGPMDPRHSYNTMSVDGGSRAPGGVQENGGGSRAPGPGVPMPGFDGMNNASDFAKLQQMALGMNSQANYMAAAKMYGNMSGGGMDVDGMGAGGYGMVNHFGQGNMPSQFQAQQGARQPVG